MASDRHTFLRVTRSIFFVSLFIAVFLSSCGRMPRRRNKKRSTRRGVYHVVKKGQTLWRIAKTYGVSLKTVSRTNGIRDPATIKEGQQIFIPGARRVKKVKIHYPEHSSQRLQKTSYSALPKQPFVWPLKGKFTSSFGIRNGRKHDGIDIAAPKGTPIKAAAEGKIIFSGWGPKGYGKIVIVKHAEGLISVYAHNSKNLVKKGEYVKQGKKIALVGSTGRSTGPHLHFEVRRNKMPYNPLKFLP